MNNRRAKQIKKIATLLCAQVAASEGEKTFLQRTLFRAKNQHSSPSKDSSHRFKGTYFTTGPKRLARIFRRKRGWPIRFAVKSALNITDAQFDKAFPKEALSA